MLKIVIMYSSVTSVDDIVCLANLVYIFKCQPTGFDHESAVIVEGFDLGYNIDNVRSFMSWYGPVIRVERVNKQDNQQAVYLVIFATRFHAEVSHLNKKYICIQNVLKLKKLHLSSENCVTCSSAVNPSASEAYWPNVSNIFNTAPVCYCLFIQGIYKLQAPILEYASQAISTLGGYSWSSVLGGSGNK